MRREEWDGAIDSAVAAGELAKRCGNAGLLHRASKSLMQLGAYEKAWPLLIAAARLRPAPTRAEWDGGDIAGQTLLIEKRNQHMGPDIRLVRLIAITAPRARRCIVLTDPRLVPLYRRTFPGVEVHPRGEGTAAAVAQVDVAANLETLGQYCAPDRARIAASFLPLRPDAELVATLRQAYRNGEERPLIGIARSGPLESPPRRSHAA